MSPMNTLVRGESNVLPPTTLERYTPYNYITMVNYLQIYVLANIYHIKIQQLTVPFITNAGQTKEKNVNIWVCHR